MSLFVPRGQAIPHALLRQHDDLGFLELDLIAPPSRFFLDQDHPPPVVNLAHDARLVARRASPSELLARLPADERPRSITRRTLGALEAWFLVCEDRQRRFEKRNVETLAHQASLVRFILDSPSLQRVLIGDEVGLGKTVEAGLIIQNLLRSEPRLRVLYLAPARLVRNVRTELGNLGMRFRLWSSDEDRDADLQDSLVVASINRAAHESNYSSVVESRPWDVLVVDECHHLSNYDPSGTSPKRQYALVRDLLTRQGPGGRLILMSGTPHQGHQVRFENLLRLLCRPGEDQGAAAGRVVYRTKEDVRDWEGNPLFPQREVNPPRIFQAGDAYRHWLVQIHALYAGSHVVGNAAQQRSAGWRSAQALQWAASSVQAGLGYQVRQAIRAGWTLESPGLREAILALRPYRLGPEDEPAEALFGRLRKDVGMPEVEDIEEEEEPDRWTPDERDLEGILRNGVALLREVGTRKWEFLSSEILDRSPQDQFVLFAQPVETVTSLARYLESRYGGRVVLIVGGQDQDERDRQVNAFWRGEARFLVASRAGYEGVNLQCAWRLVHVDVPWNPMDLEQRIGRVHRFKSRETIIADTVVMEGSREGDAYAVARRRLREIAGSLAVDAGRAELLFSRVMSIVPPEELQNVIARRAVGALSEEDQRQIAVMVEEGFRSWQVFHAQFDEQQRRIRNLDPGQAKWADVFHFGMTHAGLGAAEGFSAQGFRFSEGGRVRRVTDPVQVLSRQQDGREEFLACGDVVGRHVLDERGREAGQAGLNATPLVESLRRSGFPEGQVGAGWLRGVRVAGATGEIDAPAGVLVVARLSVISLPQGGWAEHGAELRALLVQADGASRELSPVDLAGIIRATRSAQAPLEPAASEALLQQMSAHEQRLLSDLRAVSEPDRERRVRHSVFPIAALILLGPAA